MDGLQFKINNVWVNAYATYGVMMGDGFLDTLQASSPLKPFVQNKSRLIDGKSVIVRNPKKDSRSLNLTFDLSGATTSDFKSKKDAFYDLLYTGSLIIGFGTPERGEKPTDEVFHLIYQNSVSYAQNLSQTSCKIAVKFEEPNPNNRV